MTDNNIIPAACLEQSIAIIGRTGSGKTYAAKGLVERILADARRAIILDPLGVWWGLRAAADGSPDGGLPVIVFGGEHADVPLTDGMGEVLARTLGVQNLPAIVDISEFSMKGRKRFAAAFLEALYEVNRAPLTLVLDEADMFAPQRPGKDELTMLGRVEQISRRGRVRGFRPMLITQRPASLHKSVLGMANTLIAMQLTLPHDRAALGTWIEGQADPVKGKEVLAALPKLPRGEGFVWAPHQDLLERMQFPHITTYDSSRTPADGEQLPQVTLAKVDLSAITEALAAGDEGDDDNDPKVLKARIAELEAQAAAGGTLEAPVAESEILDAEEVGYARGFAEGKAEGFAAGVASTLPIFENIRSLAGGALADMELMVAAAPNVTCTSNDIQKPAPAAPHKAPRIADIPGKIRIKGEKYPRNSDDLPAGETKILTAIAQHRNGVTREQLTVLTGYRKSSRDTYLQRLRQAGFVEPVDGGRIMATTEGVAALGDFERLPTGKALREYWLERLPEGERRVLEVVATYWPSPLQREEISRQTDYKKSSRDTYLQRLAARELITTDRGAVRASDVLFR